MKLTEEEIANLSPENKKRREIGIVNDNGRWILEEHGMCQHMHYDQIGIICSRKLQDAWNKAMKGIAR